jgi:Reverse transcriptase (RNA-dependent DNA polymerase)
LTCRTAFDTIDHSVLLQRLSDWFGITSTALSWRKYYLLSRSFYVNVENTKSSLFQFLYGVPQGSVLGPLLFVLFTIPLCIVISISSVNHHLYADDTELSLSFSLADFAYNISLLELCISNVYNLTSSNILSLNPSETDFFLVGIPQQLSKLSNPIIHIYLIMSFCSPVHSGPNLGVIYDSNLTFSQQFSAVSKSCFDYIRDLSRIQNTIDRTTTCTNATFPDSF